MITRVKIKTIKIWQQRHANTSIKPLHDALKSNGRADLANVLYKEARKHLIGKGKGID